jgi:hypothetical protein
MKAYKPVGKRVADLDSDKAKGRSAQAQFGEAAHCPLTRRGEPVATYPELNPGDEVGPESIGRFRTLVCKPRFFGR